MKNLQQAPCQTCDGTGEVGDGGELDDCKLIPCPDCQAEDNWREVAQAEDDNQRK